MPLKKESDTRASTKYYAVEVGSKNHVTIFNSKNKQVWDGDLGDVLNSAPLPQPAEEFEVWAVADRPRLVVPAEGAVPGSASSFDLTNQAADVYFYVSDVATTLSYAPLRTEVVKLTGPVPLLPDYALGTIFTWYHNYVSLSRPHACTDTFNV